MPRPTQEDIRAMHARGDSEGSIASKLGVSRNTVARYVGMEDMSPRAPTVRAAPHPATDACASLRDGEHPVSHSDRGCHYRWPGWIRICKENGITRSMSKKGCSPDNSACEGLFGRLKNEFFHFQDWSGVSMEEFICRLDAYLRYYNESRIKQSLGWLSPNQYRRSLGLAA